MEVIAEAAQRPPDSPQALKYCQEQIDDAMIQMVKKLDSDIDEAMKHFGVSEDGVFNLGMPFGFIGPDSIRRQWYEACLEKDLGGPTKGYLIAYRSIRCSKNTLLVCFEAASKREDTAAEAALLLELWQDRHPEVFAFCDMRPQVPLRDCDICGRPHPLSEYKVVTMEGVVTHVCLQCLNKGE